MARGARAAGTLIGRAALRCGTGWAPIKAVPKHAVSWALRWIPARHALRFAFMAGQTERAATLQWSYGLARPVFGWDPSAYFEQFDDSARAA